MRKLLISILVSLIVFISILPNFLLAKAAASTSTSSSGTTGTWYNQDFNSWAGKVYDKNNPSDIFGERYTAAQVQWVIYGLFAFLFKSTPAGDLVICLLSNTDPTSCDTQKLIDQLKQIQSAAQKAGTYQNVQNQSLASLIFSTDRPISGIGYVKSKIQNFSLVQTANAQTPGFGYTTALKPIQGFWGAVRNVSYGLFVLISITFAFLMMFRVKLSPQTVISVQSAIPKIIIALVLTTFSYAIAGFLIDLMYVVIGIFSLIFASLFASTSPLVQILGNVPTDPQFYFSFMTTGVLNTGIIGTLAMGGIFFFLPIVLILTVGGVIAGLVTSGLGGIIALIVIAIVIIIYLWIAIKIIWMMVKTFASLLLNVIFSPLTLALGAIIPNFGFGAWVKNIISQLSVFVTAGVLTTLSLLFGIESLSIIVETFQQDWLKNIAGLIISIILPGIGGFISHATGLDSSTPGWPPLLGLGGGYSAAFMMWAVSFVLFTMIPKSAELIQSFIQGKPFAYGSAIGEAFGPLSWAYGTQPARMFREQLSGTTLYNILSNRRVRGVGEAILGPERYGRVVGGLEERYNQVPQNWQNE